MAEEGDEPPSRGGCSIPIAQQIEGLLKRLANAPEFRGRWGGSVATSLCSAFSCDSPAFATYAQTSRTA